MILLEGAKATTETVAALRTGAAAMKAMQKATNIDDVDKTMDEINEQTENMKQIQEALSAPIGSAADFDEVFMHHIHHFLCAKLFSPFLCDSVKSFHHGRMNWRLSLKNWREPSWKSNSCNLLRLPLLPLYIFQKANNKSVLVHKKTQLKMMSLQHYKLRWHCNQVFLMFLVKEEGKKKRTV
ncbi:hypothetical protein Taro_026158 [Colocasia esculenta]|uniref:Uncharacterized protein n=1 Tax=Colocasia esculenta TaxID=4460 RepID=A0A843VEF2_COLES|nr:hypothetical protein [Colocasia esculenta]